MNELYPEGLIDFDWIPPDSDSIGAALALGRIAMPEPWPDHYPTASTPPPPDLTAMFTAPKVPPGFKRRA